MFPYLRSTVTTSQAQSLCYQFNLNYIVERMLQNPEIYRDWTFDGVSGLPDWIFRFVGNQKTVTYYCALPHDLGYAYGQLGNRNERLMVDRQFYHNLINYGQVHPIIAKICYLVVRVLGSERFGTSYSWGFANLSRSKLSNNPLPWTF